ncbi:MAG: rhomboid family intramembrane serine protease [Leptolyngbyaceae cyanobacterium SL_1_1]|nr:rhomboid family intramembrane serine protease [Leptolyngbyaceae cyanobacterium RM1_1_2]NJO11384.1 rhomboid family intramembrane serine protease [Leptolyngbyaceae cyanobacterium SL_1_1]
MDALTQYGSELTLHAQILGGIITVLWGLELIDSLILQGALNRYGIRPRQQAGLSGIVLAPLLHGSLKHLSANTLPLAVLGWFILLGGVRDFILVTAVVWLVSGVGVWLLGPPRSNHIGASGIVFGYLGFLLMRGYVERSPGAIAIAVITGLLYGGSIWGVLPIRRGQSWQGHLFGLIGGGLAAYYLVDLRQWLEQL